MTLSEMVGSPVGWLADESELQLHDFKERCFTGCLHAVAQVLRVADVRTSLPEQVPTRAPQQNVVAIPRCVGLEEAAEEGRGRRPRLLRIRCTLHQTLTVRG